MAGLHAAASISDSPKGQKATLSREHRADARPGGDHTAGRAGLVVYELEFSEAVSKSHACAASTVNCESRMDWKVSFSTIEVYDDREP
jgi:hypothetical protein